ncbi:MAG: DUF4325 domain-containing protein [Acidimicrobiia bacterium]
MSQTNTKERILQLLGVEGAKVGALAEVLNVSTQAVLYHLNALRDRDLVRQVGLGRGARWERVFGHHFTWRQNMALAEDAMWGEATAAMATELAGVNAEARQILQYVATEMLNNAIDHSAGTFVQLDASLAGDDVEIAVSDDGIGAFRRVREHFHLANELEAIAHIDKGQQTTWGERHSGQGMFFSSRAVDVFEVEANARVWKVDNLREDATVAAGTLRKGTTVTFRIAKNTSRVLKDVFDAHSIEEYAFDKGGVRVALSEHGDEFVSRSEAKRMGAGLELYGEVVLDFAGVRAVGQGFVDELFRVWVETHPGTTIAYVNANEEVAFMIERGLPSRRTRPT